MSENIARQASNEPGNLVHATIHSGHRKGHTIIGYGRAEEHRAPVFVRTDVE